METKTQNTCGDGKTSRFSHLNRKSNLQTQKKQIQIVQDLVKPHIESFNYVIYEGLAKVVECMEPEVFALATGDRISITIRELTISPPQVSEKAVNVRTMKMYPAECRGRGVSYKGQLQAVIEYAVNGVTQPLITKNISQVPIMVKSALCNLHKLSPKQLIRRGEEAEEMGGYFISNGIERIIRMIVLPRRNFPMCFKRPSWKSRGQFYTEYGIYIRCVRPDQNATNMVLHYLSDGSAMFNLNYGNQMFFVPALIVMKGLVNKTNKEIFDELMRGREDDSYYKWNIVEMFRRNLQTNLVSRRSVMEYIGKRFRFKLRLPEWYTDIQIGEFFLRFKLRLPDWYTDIQIGEFFLRKTVCIHLKSDTDKFNLLVYMIKKLYDFSAGKCADESGDSPMFQEVLLGGHVYLIALRSKLESYIGSLKNAIMKMGERKKSSVDFQLNQDAFHLALQKTFNISKSMENFLATGNLKVSGGNALMQESGLTIVADKLNYVRYVSHFRSLHRGAFFLTMRTTAVRKLLPEAWGFVCPVHTPDGTPCGLLNHLSALCQIQTVTFDTDPLLGQLYELGVSPYDSSLCDVSQCYTVMLDGRMVGYVDKGKTEELVLNLRSMKVAGNKNVPVTTEICFVRETESASQYPGLFLFTTTARMLRPVRNLALGQVEMIGTFEQVYMDICINKSEVIKGVMTHEELDERSILSFVANMTPFSDFNQSPRNMYQCQMGKQTMGTPCHSLPYRTDNKLYRIQTPQSPLTRALKYDEYALDNYPLGTNAVVAVISYTGYDMEDAMLLNKSSLERGFKHASVYKSKLVDLGSISKDTLYNPFVFGCDPNDKSVKEGYLEIDGLPPIGRLVKEGTPLYGYMNVQTGQRFIQKYKESEEAYIDNIKICGNELGTGPMVKVNITLRINRNPIVGDKFASRHGQKGICSRIYPTVDMPFTETGMTPDIVFNPHGYPSRMTIGMMIESMANKSAAWYGECYDSTPFQFSEKDSATDYFGNLLVKAGYNYYGTERMYSGVDGRELEVDIFMGIVYYQRLRHMVSDKYQVRRTGPIDPVTQQPVKGRKRHGGVRFGEMERDALIAHGTSYLLQDRLFTSSDKTTAVICKKCQTILPTQLEKLASTTAAASFERERLWSCIFCKTSKFVQTFSIPQVFKYLVAELAAMNIKVRMTSNCDKMLEE